MRLIDIVMFVLTLLFWLISFYLVIRDEKYRNRAVLIYSCIYLAIAFGITAMLQLFYVNNEVIHNLKRICLVSLLGPIAYVDNKECIIPNKFILLGLAYRAALIPLEFLVIGRAALTILLSEAFAAGAIFLAAVLCRLCIRNAIGAGDMKLFLIMGLFLSLDGIWGAILLSLFVCFFQVIFLLLTKKKTRKDSIAFAPAITIGTVVSIFMTGV